MRKCYWLTVWEANNKEKSIQPRGIELIEGIREGNIMDVVGYFKEAKPGEPCLVMTYTDIDIENQLEGLGLKRISRNFEKAKDKVMTSLKPFVNPSFPLIPDEND